MKRIEHTTKKIESPILEAPSRRQLLIHSAWATPLVISVNIPAHATVTPIDTAPSTTQAPTTTVAPIPQLTIPGISLTCTGIIQPADIQTYYVDDTGASPILVNALPPAPAVGISSGISELLPPNTVITEFVSRTHPTPSFDIQQRAELICQTGTINPLIGGGLPVSLNFQITTLSGETWQATGMVTGNSTSMTVSDITLTPA